MTITFSESKAK